jgi:hypothetical protein
MPASDNPARHRFLVAFNQYVQTALWSSTDDDDMPLDRNYSSSDFADGELEKAQAEVEAFLNHPEVQALMQENPWSSDDYERAGHDFWLTRNGHGAGFWDGYWPDKENKVMTRLSKAAGERHVLVGDDGQLYFC